MKPPLKVRSALIEITARNILMEAGTISPPVPALKIIERYAKIKWYDDDFEEGFSLKRKGKAYILLNKNMVKGRDNYTFAHELAHVVLDHLDIDEDDITDYHRRVLRREADSFAASFLMPEEWVHRACAHCAPHCIRSLGDLVRQFDVSWAAMEIRLHELGICERDYIRWLWANKSGRG